MRTKFNVFLTLILALVVQISFAQGKVITGVVTEAGTGEPLPGVNVVVKGTTAGTATDFDGKYTIKAKKGQVLVFSYVGYNTVEKTVGDSNVINVELKEGNSLSEVVVTAQGIKREKKALGYAVSTVKAEAINQKAESDVARILDGKLSGVQIVQQNGLSGSGTNILIRGLNTFSGSNQPLFIVDGVPFSADTNAMGNFVDGNNGSSRFLDLDPNNIESVNVLKGLAAATLYGSEGRNGVVLITTKGGNFKKKGKNKMAISVGSSFFINEIASLANYQNEYGNGFDQKFGWYFSNWGPSFKKDGPGGWGSDPAFDSDGTLPHPYATASPATGIPQAFPEFADARYEWKAYPSVEDFFRKGTVASLNVNVNGASDDGKIVYNAGFSNLDDTGFTPGNNLTRNNFNLGGHAILSNKFTINSTLNYAYTNFETPPVAAGFGSNVWGDMASIFGNLFYTPRSVDMMHLPYQNPITGESVYYRQNNSIQHPLWTVHNAKNQQETNRFFGKVGFSYDITDNMKLSYRYGFDVYNEGNVYYSNKGGKTGSVATKSGVYKTWNNTNRIQDHNLMISGKNDITSDIDVNYTVGANGRTTDFDEQGLKSTKQVVFGVLRHNNFLEKEEIQYEKEYNVYGVYAQTDFGYKDYLYLSLAARNDWTSILTDEHNSIFYPSASLSFIPTKAIGVLASNEYINFLKFRVGYGTSAHFPESYYTQNSISQDVKGFKTDDGEYIITNSYVSLKGSSDLSPELLKELEFGIESKLLNNRMNFDFSIYTRTTEDLLVRQSLPPESGYTYRMTNIGEIQSDGFEVEVGYDIFKKEKGLNWNSSINFTKSTTTVTDLGDNDKITYGGISGMAEVVAIEGEELGVIYGTTIARDQNGNLLVNSDGNYVEDTDVKFIGNPNPDFLANFSNTVSFKNFDLNFLVHWKQGGDIYTWTVATLLGRGVVSEDGVDRVNSFILPGVKESNGEPNDIQITNASFYFGNVLYGPQELKVYDGTVLRLQEVNLTYNFPKKILSKLPFGRLSITLSGNNLWFYAPNIPTNTNFDPEVNGLGVGNGYGLEFLNSPTSRRYGLSIKASF